MGEIPGGAQVLLPGEAKVIDAGAFEVFIHADDRTTDGMFSLIETAEHEAGAGPPLHVHHDCDESFFVLAGAYVMHLDGREFACPAGSFVFVPRGLPHTFRTLETNSRKLNLYTPAGMVGYFDELATGIRDGMTEADLDVLAERHGMEVVGPVPEGYL